MYHRILLGVAVAALLAGCDPDPIDRQLCIDRAGGALITFDVVGEAFTAWITDDAFIRESMQLLEGPEPRVPIFFEVRPGVECDPDWSWHVAPHNVEWTDITIELCDARPSYIEENLEAWIAEVGQWCPWSAEVIGVMDMREAPAPL